MNEDPRKIIESGQIPWKDLAKHHVTGFAQIQDPTPGAQTAVDINWTMPDDYSLPNISQYLAMLPSGFQLLPEKQMNFLLLLIGQSCGSWSGVATKGPAPAGGPWPAGYSSAWSTCTDNNIHSSGVQFMVGVEGFINPTTTGTTEDIYLLINMTGEDGVLVTCPGVEISNG